MIKSTKKKKKNGKMSTAFLVDNILNDKDDRSESLSSDTESDATSDLKDSLCGSPETSDLLHSSPPSSDSSKLNNLSESLLRQYNTMMRNGAVGNVGNPATTVVGVGGGHLGIEMCCAKCGHFQIIKRNDPNAYDDHDLELDFKCDKCDSHDGVNTKETILKESSKPILKFSVSAILGDKKECAKVRNGKINSSSFPFEFS